MMKIITLLPEVADRFHMFMAKQNLSLKRNWRLFARLVEDFLDKDFVHGKFVDRTFSYEEMQSIFQFIMSVSEVNSSFAAYKYACSQFVEVDEKDYRESGRALNSMDRTLEDFINTFQRYSEWVISLAK